MTLADDAGAPDLQAVRSWLAVAQDAGLVGPADLDDHLAHAKGFARALGRQPDTVLDLGSGAGLPGLVLAALWPASSVVLLDSVGRKASFLRTVVDELGWGARVSVIGDRAEVCGRWPGLRGSMDAVVARSFGPPAVTAECAGPFLRVGGFLVVSEPPPDPASRNAGRWPKVELEGLGLQVVGVRQFTHSYQLLRQARSCPERYPRRTGVPRKRPLF